MNTATPSPLAIQAGNNLKRIRETQPLVHNITNFVVMNFTANLLLATGASPVMAHAENEVEQMVSFAKALVLNIGTLTDEWVASMIKAGRKATELGIPIILDPVGAGATALRTHAAKQILAETKVSVIRGNASEILALSGGAAHTRGVDSADTVEAAAGRAVGLAKELGVPVAITGEVDFITDGQRTVRVANGHPLLARVTGTGCGATAILGAFAGVDPDPVSAAATALAFYGLAGERAAQGAEGPGSFAVCFIDALASLTPDEVVQGSRIQEV